MNYLLNGFRRVLAASGVAAILASGVQAQDVVTFSDVVDLAATVTAIDQDERLVTLRGPKGGEMAITAGPEVRNFSQLEVGDTIRLHYELDYAVEKLDPSAEPELAEFARGGVVRAEEGKRPGGVIGAVESTVVQIESIGPEGRTVTFFAPNGALEAIVVQRPEGRDFARELIAGDLVRMTVAEVVAIDVEHLEPKE